MFIDQRKGRKFSRFISASFRIGMVTLMVFTACGPANPGARLSETAPADDISEATPTPLVPQVYDAPEITPSTRTSPEADVVAVDLPPERSIEPIEFLITVSPALVNAGEEVTLSITVRNHSWKTLEGLTYTDHIESGLSFVSSSTGVEPVSGTVVYSIGDLKNGSEATFSYILTVDSFNPSYQDGELWLHSVTLMDIPGDVNMNAQAIIGVGTDLDREETGLAVVQEQGGWVSVGEVTVYIPPEAAAQDGPLVLTEQPSEEGDPQMMFDLSLVKTTDVGCSVGSRTDNQSDTCCYGCHYCRR